MPDNVDFIDHRVPGLSPGDYTIAVEQQTSLDTTTFTATKTFSVGGERYSLPPDAVTAVFPPDGSLGDHAGVLPHLVLSRSTLPWERSAHRDDSRSAPWLVLLVFGAAERPEPQIVPLSQLGGPFMPTPAGERHEHDTDPVTVIDVPRSMLEELLPAYDELPYLAHVRRRAGEDAAVIVANRLPAEGESTTVHLVSVEKRYQGQPGVFDFGSAAKVRLVSLASWRFACLDGGRSFAKLAHDLAADGHPFRLPDTTDPDADSYLRQGFIPIRHELRQGGQTVSWYRGPFVTGPVVPEPPGPMRAADHLLRYHAPFGMLDIGYAAAWQLGRLLALRSTDIAAGLYEWKRRRRQSRLRDAHQDDTGYPLAVLEIDDELPGGLRDWLTGLSRLDGVPFRYLVPDERLLPVESIRFFELDEQWVRALVDGAYSIGRLSAADAELDRTLPVPIEHAPMTGALIRSDLVAGYPGLRVDGYAENGAALPHARIAGPAPSIGLYLFEGVLARLEVHLEPEQLHFAFELMGEGRFGKTLRDQSGRPGPVLPAAALPANRRIAVRDVVARMEQALGVATGSLGPGAFARQMIESAETVTFLRKTEVP